MLNINSEGSIVIFGFRARSASAQLGDRRPIMTFPTASRSVMLIDNKLAEVALDFGPFDGSCGK